MRLQISNVLQTPACSHEKAIYVSVET